MTKPFKILIKDKKTFEKVLKQMDKDGIRWVSGECVSHCIDLYNVPIALFVNGDNRLSWDDVKRFKDCKKYSEITPEEYLKEDKTMTKADLEDWMIVETAGGSIFLVDKTHGYLICDNGHMPLSAYTDDLEHCSRYGRDYSIAKVYEPYSIVKVYELRLGSEFLLKAYLDGTAPANRKIEEDLNLIWERPESVEPESVEMTIAEIEEKLGIKNLKIVKENENG